MITWVWVWILWRIFITQTKVSQPIILCIHILMIILSIMTKTCRWWWPYGWYSVLSIIVPISGYPSEQNSRNLGLSLLLISALPSSVSEFEQEPFVVIDESTIFFFFLASPCGNFPWWSWRFLWLRCYEHLWLFRCWSPASLIKSLLAFGSSCTQGSSSTNRGSIIYSFVFQIKFRPLDVHDLILLELL